MVDSKYCARVLAGYRTLGWPFVMIAFKMRLGPSRPLTEQEVQVFFLCSGEQCDQICRKFKSWAIFLTAYLVIGKVLNLLAMFYLPILFGIFLLLQMTNI